MILSASRRTDIPCFYSEWFMRRINDGFALYRNPMNYSALYRVALTPDIVDCIVFWTKDAQNMLGQLQTLDSIGYNYYFQFTITPYGHELEPALRPKNEIEDCFIELSKRIGRHRVVWRYDPIILNRDIDVNFHKREFARMCEKLAPYTDTVVVSFVDMYAKLKTDLIRPQSDSEVLELAAFIGETASSCGIKARSCCESYELSPFGIEHGACIDRDRIEKICGRRLKLASDKNQRPSCGCCESVDIGAYDTCLNGCVYCYANRSAASPEKRYALYDPQSPILCAALCGDEIITDRKLKSARL